MARPVLPLPLHSDAIGIDNEGNLAVKSSRIIINADSVDEVSVPSGVQQFVIDEFFCDNTGATDVGSAFTRMARRACGLSASGVGTAGEARPIFLAAGTYLLQAWNPTDSNGYALPVNLFAYPGTVKITNRLSLSNESSGAIDISYASWQAANKVQQAVTAVVEGLAPATFGITTAASNDDVVTSLLVADTTGFLPGDLANICTQNNFPHTNASSNKGRIGECFRIMNVDATHIYVQGKLSFHDFYETGVYVTRYDTSRTFRAHGIIFEGAATTIGLTTATPLQLDRGLWGFATHSIVSLTRSGTTATAITDLPHGLTTGHYVHVSGTNEDNYSVTVPVTVVDAITFTYTLPTKNDANTTFGTAPGSATTPATGTIVYQDAFANLDTTALGAAVTVRNGPGARFENCEFNDCWTMGVRLYASPEWRMSNCNIRGLPNAGTSANDFNSGRLGYGVSIYAHSSLGVYEGGTVRNCRHVITSDGKTVSTYTPTNDTSSSAWTVLGGPTQCLIKDVNSYDAWGIPFDVHEEGSDITYMNCWAYNPQRGPQGGSYVGAGFQVRCRNMRIINCGQRGGQFGIRISATEQLGHGATYGTSQTPAPLTYTVTSLTQAAGVATFVHGTGINGVNTGAHLVAGDLIRLRGSDQENYNVTVAVLTYTESTKTGTFTLPTKDDLGATFATLPANVTTPATGTITMRPFFRTQHVVKNFFCENLRKGKSGAVILDRLDSGSGVMWKNKVLVDGLTIRGLQCGINADGGTVCDANNITASQMVYDASSDQSGAVVGTLNTAVVHVGSMMLDVTDSVSNAPGIYPARLTNGSVVTIGHLTLKQHPTYLACPRVFENKDATSGKSVGLGKLVYDNPGSLAPSTAFAIIKIGQEANFTWLFGGEELSIPCQIPTITSSLVTVGQRGLFSRFILRRAGVMLDANAVGTITIDVKLNGTTIFGASKIAVAIGAATSDAAVPTYATLLLTDPSALTVTAQSSSGSETAKVNNVSLTGYFV